VWLRSGHAEDPHEGVNCLTNNNVLYLHLFAVTLRSHEKNTIVTCVTITSKHVNTFFISARRSHALEVRSLMEHIFHFFFCRPKLIAVCLLDLCRIPSNCIIAFKHPPLDHLFFFVDLNYSTKPNDQVIVSADPHMYTLDALRVCVARNRTNSRQGGDRDCADCMCMRP